MNFIQAIILGAIEGLTEFLPISSTAHLILTGELIRVPATDFTKTFEVVIQLGAILAVVGLYIKKLFRWDNIKKLAVAFVPTAIIGFGLYKIIKGVFFENKLIIVLALIIGGLFLIIFEHYYKTKKKDAAPEQGIESISYAQCLIIGLCQSLAVVPGVSRAAATIIGGLALGISRKAIVEFSFLLAVPTMVAASGYDLYKTGINFSGGEVQLLILGFAVAFAVALLSVKSFIKYIQRYNFQPFGVYRILIGLLFLWLLI
ncbi:MAG TPA: undecaprenyl-diphosphatase UppP [bacterium]|nr:undecaprenyl-diphosphatase UppP [bacterium]HPT30049.1 undecaprenyl-diphosphatase UppP [bacterium]